MVGWARSYCAITCEVVVLADVITSGALVVYHNTTFFLPK